MSDMQSQPEADQAATESARWQPVGTIERRVLGVLVEKAKTTPDAYPLTLNALTNGCNQKSNRDPQMNLEPDRVEEALENLRQQGAVAEVQGGGRVAKYRHYLYDWLGVDKVELAVMAELLLRGPQTLGELRGRAARMEPIADVAALRPVVQSLIEKQLVLALTPAGRGQIVTHNLYPPEQLEKVRRQLNVLSGTHELQEDTAAAPASAPPSGRAASPPPSGASTPASVAADGNQADLAAMRRELDQLKGEVARLRGEVEDLWSNITADSSE